MEPLARVEMAMKFEEISATLLTAPLPEALQVCTHAHLMYTLSLTFTWADIHVCVRLV